MEARTGTGPGSGPEGGADREICVVLSTFDNEQDASRIGRELVERRLAACVNIVHRIRSIYWWEGEVEEGEEVLAIMKTRRDRLRELLPELAQLHPYDVPEILALPVVDGEPGYLAWAARESSPYRSDGDSLG